MLVDVPFVLLLVFVPVIALFAVLPVVLPLIAPEVPVVLPDAPLDDVPVLESVVVPPLVVLLEDVLGFRLVDVGDSTVNVPSIVSLKESMPSIEWSTFMSFMLMPLPLMVTFAVAPSAGDMLTVVEKSPSSNSKLFESALFVWAEVVLPVEPPEVEPDEAPADELPLELLPVIV